MQRYMQNWIQDTEQRVNRAMNNHETQATLDSRYRTMDNHEMETTLDSGYRTMDNHETQATLDSRYRTMDTQYKETDNNDEQRGTPLKNTYVFN